VNWEQVLQEYHLHAKTFFQMNGKYAFNADGINYIISDASDLTNEEVVEIKMLGDHLYLQGEESVAVLLPNRNQQLVTEIDNDRIMLYRQRETKKRYYFSPGHQLASFHKRGRHFTYGINNRNRYGNWETYWTSRLEQLEAWCHKRLQDNPTSRFEKTFIETFPYYMGLTENAIQYIADCKWDNNGNYLDLVDHPTICFERYPLNADPNEMILPEKLVYDHPTRDLAEWIRQWFVRDDKNNAIDHMIVFLNEYEQMHSLSIYSWKVLYGRLLFPLHYFELVEGFYTSTTEYEKHRYEEQFLNYIEGNDRTERFLSTFYERIGLSPQKFQIKELPWLKKAK
jgi:spore coat protein YutH